MVTAEQLLLWKKLAEEATPGPWNHDLDVYDPDEQEVCAGVFDESISFLFTAGTSIKSLSEDRPKANATPEYRNAAFIAASREAVPALIAEVERYRGALELIVAAGREPAIPNDEQWKIASKMWLTANAAINPEAQAQHLLTTPPAKIEGPTEPSP